MASCSGTSREYNLILDVNQVSQNIAGNYSTVSWSLRFTCGQYYYQNGSTTDNFKVYIDGQLVYNQNRAISFPSKNSSLTIASGQTNVSHNTDGTKAISFSCHFAPGRSASYYPGTINGSGSTSLTTIPRASVIGTVTYSNFWSGFKIAYTKYYSGFTCKLRVSIPAVTQLETFSNYNSNTNVSFSSTVQSTIMQRLISNGSIQLGFVIETWNGSTKIGESSETKITISKPTITQITSVPNFNIDEGFTITLSKSYPSYTSRLDVILSGTTVYSNTIGNSQKIEFSSTQLQTIYNLMKTVNTATFTLRVTSLYGSTNCGSVSVNKTGTITNASPTLPGFTWETINHLDLHDNQTIIKGQSNIKVSIQQASAYKGADIAYYQVKIGDNITKVSSLEASISNCTSNIITVYAVDSRGNAVSKQMVCEKYIEYKPITVEKLEYARDTGGIGSGVTINFSGNIHTGSFGIRENEIHARYYYKEVNASDYLEGTTEITPILQSKYSKEEVIKGNLDANGFSIDKNFYLKVVVSDKLSSYTKEIILAKGTPTLAIHEDGVSLGTFYDENAGGALQVKGFNIIDIIHPIGTLIEFGRSDINPNILPQFMGTTWQRYGEGMVTAGVKANDSDFNTVGKTLGVKTFNNAHSHTIASHIHGTGNCTLTIAQMPSHNHYYFNTPDLNGYYTDWVPSTSEYRRTSRQYNMSSTGGGQAHNHGNTAGSGTLTTSGVQSASQSVIQPTIVVSRWIRIK